MVTQLTGAAEEAPPHPAAPPPSGTGLAGQLGKILLLGLTAALAIWGAFPLISAHAWPALAVLAAVTALIFWVYLSPRRLPLKYLIPGTLFLIACQLIPVLYTVSTAFSNFGDGHRGSKQDAVVAIQSASVKQVPGSAEYSLSVATKGSALVF